MERIEKTRENKHYGENTILLPFSKFLFIYQLFVYLWPYRAVSMHTNGLVEMCLQVAFVKTENTMEQKL